MSFVKKFHSERNKGKHPQTMEIENLLIFEVDDYQEHQIEKIKLTKLPFPSQV